jgi:hypothetical protein
MRCLITLMVWCELWPRKPQIGRKTDSLLWGVQGKKSPDIMPKWLRRLVCSSFQHIALIHSGSCNRLGRVTSEWILILKTRLHIPHNTRRPFWSMQRMNIAQNIDVCRSLSLKWHWTPISAPSKWLLDLGNHLMIRKICPARTMNT